MILGSGSFIVFSEENELTICVSSSAVVFTMATEEDLWTNTTAYHVKG